MAKNANPKTWNFTGISRATYVSNDLDGSGVNIDPVASFTTSASLLVVDVDASGSSDSDGTITSYVWDWGDATANGSGATAQHTYASAGTYTITLTVTDNNLATNQTTRQVTISASAQGHQLSAGRFIPAKMGMTLVYPRPDTETQAHARHRLLSTEIDYRIPIGVQGGAWPFHYEIITAPAGTTIGTYDTGSGFQSDYGVVNLPAASVPASGTVSFRIRITDQELNSVDAVWEATVDDAAFVYLDNSVVSSGTGTSASPLKDWSDAYLGSDADSTYANKVWVFRTGSGNYTVEGNNGNVQINSGTKTPSLIAFPGDTPTLECATAKLISAGGSSLDDIYVHGIRFYNANPNVPNSHFFRMNSAPNRASWFECTFDTLSPGTSGTDNNGCIFVSNNSIDKEYFLFKNNRLTEIRNGASSNGMYFELYRSSYVLYEGNTVDNSDSTYGFYAKATNWFITIRANEAWDNVDGRTCGIGYSIANGGATPHDHEICWNRMRIPTGDSLQHIMTVAVANSHAGASGFYNTFIFRNTFVNGAAVLRFAGSDNYELADNVIISDDLSAYDTSNADTIPAGRTDVTGSEASGIVDQTGNFIGANIAAYRGFKGWEVVA